MKQIYYAIQNIIRGKDATLIKVASLSLGLFISIILFARVALKLSYDTYYQDSERLYVVQTAWDNTNGKKNAPSPYNIYPTGDALARHFPEHVESSTVLNPFIGNKLKHGSETYSSEILAADSLFFQTMGIPLIEGNALELANPGSIFLSQSFARKIFGSENVMGKTLLWGDEKEMIVRGIFADIPENATIKPTAVTSISSTNTRKDWTSGGNFMIFLRMKKEGNSDFINQRTETVLANYLPINDYYKNFGVKGIGVSITPLQGYHIGQGDVMTMIYVMSLLAFVLLFTAAFNYALVSISSLSKRAKAIGVHKCSGAETRNIFGMFFWETLFVVGFSILIAVFLIFNFHEQIEEMTDATLEGMFSAENLWAPTLAILLLFIIGVVLPGRLFSSIPVTQVFRRYTEGKKRWKYPLLFIQFGGTAFLMGFVTVIFYQYQYSMSKDLGWNRERVAFVYHYFDNLPNTMSNLRNLPYVEGTEVSQTSMLEAYQPKSIKDNNGNIKFYPRINYCNTDFCQFIGIRLKAGSYPTREGEILVNTEFVEAMGWSGNGIGEIVPDLGTITGILENYAFADSKKMQPFCLCWNNYEQGNVCLHTRLKEPFEDNLLRLNEDMKKLYPQSVNQFKSYETSLEEIHHSARIFRNSAMVACITILVITLMGIIGYTNDEVHRKSKEIAIRKVNGAEVSDILRMLCRDIIIIAVPAVLIGTWTSGYIGHLWISANFKDIIAITPLLYVGVFIVTIGFILITVIIKTWKIANENPVKSIKSE